jgi:hypothetical protein
MEVRRGTVSKSSHTLSVSGSGGGDNTVISTKHHTNFSLDDGTTVMFSSGGPAVIRDGDQVIVAGLQSGGLMRAEAYWNITAHVRGDSGRWAKLFSAVLGLLLGLVSIIAGIFASDYMLGFPADLTSILIASALGLFFGGFGVYNAYKWLRIRAAMRALDNTL